MLEKIKAVIFDCDGVIIDSSNDIANSVNITLEHFNLSPLPVKQIVSYIGNGAKKLIQRSVNASINGDISEKELNTILDWYVKYYNSHPVEQTVVTPEFINLLEKLMEKNIKTAVVSNKPQPITEKILSYFDIEDYFEAIIGPEQLTKIKPDPEGLELALSQINIHSGTIQKEQVLMVGDSAVDIQAGKNFGCLTCGILQGMGNQEQLLNENPDIKVNLAGELINLI